MGRRVWRSWPLGELRFEVADRRKYGREGLRRTGGEGSAVYTGHVKTRKGIEIVSASLVACKGELSST